MLELHIGEAVVTIEVRLLNRQERNKIMIVCSFIDPSGLARETKKKKKKRRERKKGGRKFTLPLSPS